MYQKVLHKTLMEILIYIPAFDKQKRSRSLGLSVAPLSRKAKSILHPEIVRERN